MAPKKYSERKREERRSANNETTGVILVIASAFLLLCLITREWILGVIGAGISSVFMGVLGYLTYPVLLYCLILGILKIKNVELSASKRLIASIIFAIACIVMIAHLASSSKYLGEGFSAYLGGAYNGKDTVGGALFSIITYLFFAVFKTVFSYVIYSIALLLAIGLISKSLLNGDSVSTSKPANKRRKYIARNAYSNDTFGSASKGGLFVGTIIKPENRNYEASEGSFDEMPVEDKLEAPEYEPELSEDEYRRKRARELLFGDRANFTFTPAPKAAPSTPAPSTAPQSNPQLPPLPKVVVPPAKYFEHEYVEGEIINGDARSEELNRNAVGAENTIKADEPSAVNGFTSYTPSVGSKPAEEPSAPVAPAFGNDDSFVPGPIINGDFYVHGEKLPIVEEPEKYEDTAPIEPVSEVEEETVEPVEETDVVATQPLDNVPEIEYSDTFEDESASVDNSFEAEEECEEPDDAEESFNPFEGIVVASKYENVTEASIPEEYLADVEEELEESEQPAAETEEEVVEESVDEEITNEEPSDDMIIDDTALGDEPVESFIATPETDADDLTAEVEDELTEEEAAKIRSDAFESSTTSFIIEDEVEDLSETGFSNPDDTTGYYNKIESPVVKPTPVAPTPSRVAPSAFETRVKDIDKKINVTPPAAKPVAEQLDIDSITASNAQKRLAEEKPVEVKPAKPKKPAKYIAPPLDLLVTESTQPDNENDNTQEKIDLLEESLEMLGVPAKVTNVTCGPAITRFEMDMPHGMSVRRIENLADDIRYNLASKGQIRIESPIPGKRAVGIEVPNDKIYTVALKDIIGSPEFKASSSPLTIALGKDIQGKIMLTRLEKMPHLLIAGATGSGKSSCLNSLLISLMYKASPQDVKLILIDPKRVEFTAYNGVPHMMIENAITDVKKAILAFKWACDEMERRYITLQTNCVRDIGEYNSMPEVKEGTLPKMQFIVIIVDELANLMMSSKADRKILEEAISQLASKARAAGIHLVLATQRPSVDVITGTIKANLPSRIAFAVSTMQDSRIILDSGGAEALLGRGDMLYAPLNESEETRIQGAFVENFEVKNIVDFVKSNNSSDFDDTFGNYISPPEPTPDESAGDDGVDTSSPYEKELIDVVRCVITVGKASSALIQRRFRFGWNKAARIMDQMEELHFVGPQEGGAKSREIYITPEKFEEFFGEPL